MGSLNCETEEPKPAKPENYPSKSKNLIEENTTLDYFKFSSLDLFYFYTGLFGNAEREKKKLILKKGEKILIQSLDIKFLIQKIYEIEKLKCLLLSEEDLKVFNTSSKPVLDVQLGLEKGTGNITTSLFDRRISIF